MLRKISKLSFFLQFLLFIGIAVLFWLPELAHPHTPLHFESEGPLYTACADVLQQFPLVSSVVALLLVMGLGILIYFIGTINDILPRENFLSAILLVLLLSSNSKFLLLHPLLPAGLLLGISMYTLMAMYGKTDPYQQVFMASFTVGLASMFYLPFVFFLLMVWLSLITYRIATWREWVIALIGMLLPFIYLISYYFWNDTLSQGISGILDSVDDPGLSFFGLSKTEVVYIVSSLLIVTMSSFLSVNLVQEKLISIRRKVWIMLNTIILTVFLVMVSYTSLLMIMLVLFIPLSFLIALSLSLVKRGLAIDIIFSLFIGLLVCMHFLNLI